MDFFINNLYTVILFPLWIFLIVVLGRFFNLVQSKRIVSILTLISTLYGLIFAIGCFLYLINNPGYTYDNSYSFLKIADYSLNFGVYVDNLSVLMLLVVTSVSLIVQFYSSNYMYKDKSFPRFFGYLNLFNFSMIGLVLSSNLFQNYVFWELVGVSSYLLIGFWYKKLSASKAAKKAFLMNRIGDVGLLAGTIAISYFMYQYSGSVSMATVPYSSMDDIANYLYSYTNDFVLTIICILLLMGSLAKSAQFPLHTWLADAMEGPTPVSALIHSATMVAAGVYLIARIYPIFTLSETIMNIIAIIGLVTAILCAYFAITQNDFKRILAYSTSSQLGLMFLALGAGAYTGGLFHLVTHAYFKSMLFLCSGVVIHSLSEQQDIRFMGGLRKTLPLTAICYLTGCISISGISFSGFYSKEMIFSSLWEGHYILYSFGFLIVALMTAFYMFRSYFVVFEGDYRGSNIPSCSHPILDISVFVLAILTATLGYLVNSSFTKFIHYGNNIPQAFPSSNATFIALFIAFIGLILVYMFYFKNKKLAKVPILYKLSFNKLYIDNFYDFLANRIYSVFADICAFIDKYIVDGLVLLSALSARTCSWIFAKMQTGNFQSYIAYSVIFFAMAITALMFAYTVIIQYSLLSGG